MQNISFTLFIRAGDEPDTFETESNRPGTGGVVGGNGVVQGIILD